MHKNEFEKQMRQKMDALKIHPSETVWQNVEAAITSKKHRRRGWIFLAVLLMGLLGGGYFLWHQQINPTIDHLQDLSAKSFTEKNNHSQKVLKIPATKERGSGTYQPNKISAKNIEKTNQHNQVVFTPPIIKRGNHTIKTSRVYNNKVPDVDTSLKKLQKEKEVYHINQKVYAISELPYIKNDLYEPTRDLHQESKRLPPEIAETNIEKENIGDLIQTDKGSIAKNESTKNNTTSLKRTIARQSWKWGLTFSAGASGIPNTFLGSLDRSYRMADALSTAPQNNVIVLPSKIASSGALVAGLFAEKNILKNKRVVIGLNYKMFSTTSKVGVRNESLRAYSVSNPVNNYRNYYHFLELPVALKFQLSTKKVLLFWDAGMSISHLIGSNALQFNNAAGIYRKENAVFNKSQLGFNSGLSVSLFSRSKTSILIGPYIYYGTTKIAREGLYKNQHFTFIGVRSQILFKK